MDRPFWALMTVHFRLRLLNLFLNHWIRKSFWNSTATFEKQCNQSQLVWSLLCLCCNVKFKCNQFQQPSICFEIQCICNSWNIQICKLTIDKIIGTAEISQRWTRCFFLRFLIGPPIRCEIEMCCDRWANEKRSWVAAYFINEFITVLNQSSIFLTDFFIWQNSKKRMKNSFWTVQNTRILKAGFWKTCLNQGQNGHFWTNA